MTTIGSPSNSRPTAGGSHAPPQARSRSVLRRNGGPLGLLAVATWTELRSTARSAEFAVGAVVLPVILYVMFGLPEQDVLDSGTPIATAMTVSLSAYGVVSLAIFTFGENVARERGRGWTRTLRATPMPMPVHLLAKAVTAVAHATLIVTAISVLAATAAEDVDLSTGTWFAFGATMVGGVVVFSTLGFAIALLARPRTATIIANLVFLPLAFASGFFVPLSELPAGVRTVAPWLPTFHFGQLAYRIVMPARDVHEFTGVPTRPIGVHVVVVVASTVVLGGIALLAAHREAVTRRG